jgi:hypothetical protein
MLKRALRLGISNCTPSSDSYRLLRRFDVDRVFIPIACPA